MIKIDLTSKVLQSFFKHPVYFEETSLQILGVFKQIIQENYTVLPASNSFNEIRNISNISGTWPCSNKELLVRFLHRWINERNSRFFRRRSICNCCGHFQKFTFFVLYSEEETQVDLWKDYLLFLLCNLSLLRMTRSLGFNRKGQVILSKLRIGHDKLTCSRLITKNEPKSANAITLFYL